LISVGQHIRNLDDQAGQTQASLKAVREELVELKKSVQQEKKRTDEALRRFESQFSEAESERRKESQQHLTKLQNQISEVKQQFISSEESRQTRFADNLEIQKNEAEQVIAEFTKRREELEEEYRQEVKAYVEKLEQQKEEAEDIVGAVAQTGMAGGYQQIADSEQVSARVWQVITVISLMGFVGLMIWVVPSTSDGGFAWLSFTQRTLAALGLGGLAAYSGKQAAKHGERERHNRRLELEIASVGPFLAQLPKDEQDAVIKEVADRTFGRGTRSLVVEESPTTTNGLIELLRMAIDSLTKR
jgi:flagellar biosynthesis GTPase FlhF